MRLPRPRAGYDPRVEAERNRVIEDADRRNLKKGRDVEIEGGRLILTDSNGVRYEVGVDTSGNLTTTSL